MTGCAVIPYFHRRKGATYGVGIPEMMYPISKEMDAMHNMRIDFGIIRQQQILVRQMRGRTIGTFLNQNAAMKHGTPTLGCQAAPEQIAGSVFCNVLDVQTRIDMATSAGNQAAIGMNSGTNIIQSTGTGNITLSAELAGRTPKAQVDHFHAVVYHKVDEVLAGDVLGIFPEVFQHAVVGKCRFVHD